MTEYEKVFSFNNLKESARKCKLGVRWKPSVQKFSSNEIIFLSKICKSLQSGTYKSRNFYYFDKKERGKLRHIKSQCIEDRVVHKCFCDNYLVPKITPKLIYDNSACIKGKGVAFARKRVVAHLHKHYAHFKNGGYILQFDISSFFENIDHIILKEKVLKIIDDEKLAAFFVKAVDDNGDKGLGLGSQISQICATFYLNELDHFIKQKLKIKYYARYMDDGYLLHPDKEYLKYCLVEIEKILKGLGLSLNKKKTHIIKLQKGFTFLKRRYIMLETGKIISTPSKDGVVRQRRKMKRMFKRELPMQKIAQSIASWGASILGTRSWHILQNIKKLFWRLRITYIGHYKTNKEGIII